MLRFPREERDCRATVDADVSRARKGSRGGGRRGGRAQGRGHVLSHSTEEASRLLSVTRTQKAWTTSEWAVGTMRLVGRCAGDS